MLRFNHSIARQIAATSMRSSLPTSNYSPHQNHLNYAKKALVAPAFSTQAPPPAKTGIFEQLNELEPKNDFERKVFNFYGGIWSTVDPYLRLARWQAQIGTHLLLLPCFWGIALGSPGFLPSLATMGLFTAGAIGCRSAGCIINDFADRDIDKHVDRTKARPLTTGELSPKQAGLFLTGLMAMNFGVLFSLPWECVKLGLMVTPIVFLYPTTKRFFRYPQFVLGVTFNSGVMIGYAAAAANAAVNWSVCAPFYLGGILWTIIYDSIYAFQDRKFDKKLNLNSTAIVMENKPKLYLSLLSAASLGLFALGGINAGLSPAFFTGLSAVAAHYAWQIKTLDIEHRQTCWNLFQSNRWLGLILMFTIIGAKYVKEQEEAKSGKKPTKEEEE